MKKILAIIPARGGSKRLPSKNIRRLAGKPLIQYTIEAALRCPFIDRVVVSTDDKKIASVAKRLGAEIPVLRPKKLATDAAPTLPVLQHMVRYLGKQGYRPDVVVTLQPTSPLRTSSHLTRAIQMFLSDPLADSLVSTVRVPGNFIPECVMKKNHHGYLELYKKSKKPPVRNQTKPQYFARNGAAIYITKTGRLKHYLWGGRLLNFVMDETSSQDIDSAEDLQAAQRVLKTDRKRA